MSERQFTVRLTANIAQFRQAMNEAKRSSEQASNTGIERFGALGTSATTLGRTLTTRVTLPLVGVAAGAIKTAVDFDSSMTKIQSLVGLSAAEVDGMRDAVMQLAGETAQAPGRLADALFFITSAGLSGSEALDVLEMSAKASAIGLGDTATIADLVTSAVNAYGSEVLSAAQATDDLTMAVRLGKLEPAQLAGAMGQVLPLASAMGVGFEEIAAAMASMSRTGTNANVAATQLRGIFSQLLSPTTQAEKALSSVGLSVDDIHRSLREDGLLATLELLVASFDGNAAATEAVFGNIRALSGVVDMLGANADGTRMIFDEMSNTVGVTDEAFGIVSETVGFKMKQAFADLQVSLLSIGDILIPIVSRFADVVSTLFNAFNTLPEPVKELLVVAGGLAALAGPLIWMFGTLITSTIALKGAVSGLTLTMLKNPLFLGITAAVLAVTTAMSLFRGKTEEVTEEVEELDVVVEDFDSKVKRLFTTMQNTSPIEVFKNEVANLAAENHLMGRAMAAAGITIDDLVDSFNYGESAAYRQSQALLANVDAASLTNDEMLELSAKLRDLQPELGLVSQRMFDGALAAGASREEAEELRAKYLELQRATQVARIEAKIWADIQLEAAAGSTEHAEELRKLEQQLGFLPDAFANPMSEAQLFETILNDAFNEVNKAADELRTRVERATDGAVSSFMSLSQDGKKHIDTFVAETLDGSRRLQQFQLNVVSIASQTSGEFGLYLYEMGQSGEQLVRDLANPRNRDRLQAAFDAWVLASGATSTNMAEEFAKVDPAFEQTLQGVAGLTKTQMDLMALQAATDALHLGRVMGDFTARGIDQNSPLIQSAMRTAVQRAINTARSQLSTVNLSSAVPGSPFRPPGRLHGGPVSPGRLYEVTEDGVAELLQMGGRQYLIPGQQGTVVPLSQAGNVSNVSNSSATTVNVVNNRRDLTPADVSMALSMAELAA